MKKINYLLMLSLVMILLQANAQYTNLYSFMNIPDGKQPYGDLYSDGVYLYGMTLSGGTNNYGTVFKILPNGTGYTKLLDFDGTTNGSNPGGSLISDGTYLYGMTYGDIVTFNVGTIFKILPDGTGYIKLLDFAGITNGSFPSGSLISDGTFLYGMTQSGGTNNMGTVFKILPDGTGYIKLLDFNGTTNGSGSTGSLISDGTYLYGMTSQGGTNNMGTIFKILPDGTGYIKLLDLNGTTNGGNPTGSLISDGIYLYGMTRLGGTNNYGTVFKILPDGTGYSNLLSFNLNNGRSPEGSLISDGTYLYGMTQLGGTNNYGTVFKILPDGTGYIKLLDFNNGTNGSNPYGSLISDGTYLYGMTYNGGTNGFGTIFKYICTPTNGTDIQTTCGNYTWIDGVTYTVSNNTATYTLTNLEGCDSTATLNLTITTIDNTTTLNNDTLTANETAATYRWLNCDSNNVVIAGVTTQSFIPPVTGNYAVEITVGSCVDTSACVNVIITNIEELTNAGIKIYPNPVDDKIVIELGNTSPTKQVNIVSIEGKLVYSNTAINSNKLTVDAAAWSKGVYVVNIITDEGKHTLQLIKQ